MAALGLLATGTARAGTEITMETQHLTSGKTDTVTLSVAPDRMRVELTGRAMLFRGDQSKTYMLDEKAHTYLDLSAMRQMMGGGGGAGAAAGNPNLQAKLAQLPPEQREKIAAMMAQRSGGGAPTPGQASASPLTYEKGEAKTIGQWSCTVYHEKRDGVLVADVCIAPLGQLGVSEADLTALKNFGQSMAQSMGVARQPSGPAMQQFDLDAQTKAVGFAGFPVQSTSYRNGQAATISTFKSFTHKDFSPDLFELPAGYTPRDMTHGGGAPMGGDDQ
jgi:hypothetical protein